MSKVAIVPLFRLVTRRVKPLEHPENKRIAERLVRIAEARRDRPNCQCPMHHKIDRQQQKANQYKGQNPDNRAPDPNVDVEVNRFFGVLFHNGVV